MTPARRLHPRHRIDIDAGDLVHGLLSCARRPDAAVASRALEDLVDHGGQVLPTLSVRSGFDLLLSALALPKGSEVLLSALTIPDMARLVRAHGLVPVPVDVDPKTLGVTRGALERAWSSQSRVLVVVQLFGGKADLAAAVQFSRDRGLVFVDDSAQGYVGPASLRGSPGDVVFHSFGSIKTATCLGGALVRVREEALLGRMRELHETWQRQGDGAYARKLWKYAALLAPRNPAVYALFAGIAETSGRGLDEVVTAMAKGFPAPGLSGFLQSLRRRPSGALQRVMARRIGGYDGRRVARRREAGETAREALSPVMDLVGQDQSDRTHWLLAVLVDDPASYLPSLRRAGFDAARGATSITAIAAPPERPEVEPLAARRVMERILFLPVYPEISQPERARLVACLKGLRTEASGAAAFTT